MNSIDAIDHLYWTIEKSPKAYALLREGLTNLRIAIVNAELRYQEEQNDQGNC